MQKRLAAGQALSTISQYKAYNIILRAALLAVLATKPDELSGELLLLYRELKDNAARDPL